MNGTLQHKDIDWEHTGQYHLALKLDDNGFSFALYNPAVNGSYIYRKETFDLNLHNYLFALENAVYSYPVLLQNFRKTQILVQPEHFTFIPLPFASSRDNEIYFRFCFPESKDEILENNLSRCGSQLLFGIAPDVSDFLRRTFDRPQILHHLTPLCEYFTAKAGWATMRKCMPICKKEIWTCCVSIRKGYCSQIHSVSDTSTMRLITYLTPGSSWNTTK